MSWQSLIATKGPVWQGVEGYADERIRELSAICVSQQSSDAEIRSAQAGIVELERLKNIPEQLRATAEISKGKTRREY